MKFRWIADVFYIFITELSVINCNSSKITELIDRDCNNGKSNVSQTSDMPCKIFNKITSLETLIQLLFSSKII